MDKKQQYFELRYTKKITEFLKIAKEENTTDKYARNRYNTINTYYCMKLEIDSKKLNSIKEYFQKYHDIYTKYYNDDREEIFSFNNYEELIKWYDNQGKKCGYCNITQEELEEVVKKRGGNLTLNKKTKRSKGTLEIEKLDPNKLYTLDNIILACPLCNNAKSNLIDEASWRNFFVDPMKKYYEEILKHKPTN